ncbi:MAG TPA: lysophospholipid acyltransferase family protein [Chitinophagales bacterium]|nr:lysophospholipid acyltransferase family protein [Chitinophagales bacterium]HNJ00689.1 lysophospholipid acyltransferase family protein [Chitinophagales bacterium]
MQWLLTKIGIFYARLLSYFPLNLLFTLADIIYFIFNRIYAYRKTIIDLNLMNAFPHKKSEELWFIRSNYYRHLADLIIETIKSISISKNELKARLQLQHDSYALLKNYENRGQHIFVVLGHYGNWEWASLLAGITSKLPSYALYSPPSNKTFEHFLLKNRARFGCQLVAANQLKTLYANLLKQTSLVAILADQTPVDTENAYWTKFMSINTPFYKGFDTLARRTDAIVLYASIRKINRAYYELSFETITENASQTAENEIVEKYVRLLENDIQQRPEYWLWSHRRWKRAGISY